MTPIVRPRPTAPHLTPPPPARSKVPGQEIEPLKIRPDSPLLKILQSSGRTPTHPLTAKPQPVETKQVTPVDAQKAEAAFKEALAHAKRGRTQKIFQALEKAYGFNPNDEKIAGSLSQILAMGGQPLLAHDLLTEFLGRHPDAIFVRGARSSLSQILIPQLQAMAAASPEDQGKKLKETAEQLLVLSATDQAMIIQADSGKIRNQLEVFEKEADKFHAQETKIKAAVLGELQAQAQMMFELSKLPTLPEADREAIRKNLQALGSQTMRLVIRRAETDGDETLKAQAPLLKAQLAILEGRKEEAVAIFETYRETQCKALGDGDSEKGLSQLSKKYNQAKKQFESGKTEEAQKTLEGVPEGLLAAHDFLHNIETEKLWAANLSALAGWEEKIHDRAKAEAKEANGFWGTFGQAWDVFNEEPTALDDIAIEERKSLDLVAEVRKRLATRECLTIVEALTEISENGSSDIKDRAKTVLASAEDGSSESAAEGCYIHYASRVRPDKEAGAQILAQADAMAEGNEAQKQAAAGLYAMVQFLSRDAAQRAEAKKSYEKLPEAIRKPAT